MHWQHEPNAQRCPTLQPPFPRTNLTPSLESVPVCSHSNSSKEGKIKMCCVFIVFEGWESSEAGTTKHDEKENINCLHKLQLMFRLCILGHGQTL